jgi:hypothetical protein
MKMFNDISFNEINSSKEYFMFEYESLSLSEITGSDLIKLICDKFDYEDWKVEEIENGDDGDVESFLDWSSNVNDDSSGDEWIRVYEK